MTPNFSVISRDEVISGMRTAKNAKQQKKIFADLCSCTVADIDKIIKEEEMKSFYTLKEIEYIKQAVQEGKTNREIAEHLGREYRSIEQKIYLMRKSGEIPPPRRRDSYTAQASAASEVRIIRPAGPIESPNPEQASSETTVPAVSAPEGELEFYKAQLAVAEAALEKRTKELFAERVANAELRILAQMIAKAVEV